MKFHAKWVVSGSGIRIRRPAGHHNLREKALGLRTYEDVRREAEQAWKLLGLCVLLKRVKAAVSLE